MPASPTRRRLLQAGLATGGLALAAPARAMLPPAATLLVPGPEDGPLARLAAHLAASLARGATTAIRLGHSVLGGPDGVTAANRFVTESAPDGRTLLLLPGAAPLARLVGDPRARFDPAGWLPVCALQGSAVLAGREAMPPPGAAPRFGLGAPDMPGAAGLLALDLLGFAASPVLGLPPPRAEAALAQGVAEAVLLHGADIPGRLAACGARPWFTLEPAGQRDPALPDLPSLHDLRLLGPPELRAALAAAAASIRLQAALVLPPLTPADIVAAWRGAALRWLEEEGRQGWAPGLRALPGTEAAPLLAAIAPPPSAALAYREWLLRRLNWRAD
ncbi:hypothetical protein [Paracraurococcus lichenis]|uniref:Twin-arginine translocation pathway signal protein n=1 Tax=Paracraurococcus lichenis TaxID=3064888 RepID=A0ABT9DUF3_9PROT|nr:hypothetical protein [Paracraurococcus sp. LOR1-02]MDO9707530.1 hypothetical protein [Paracraurococcus sp. LOR1-02]